MTELIFVRHGEQHIPDPRGGPMGDTFDPPLSERGEQQAKAVGERLSTDRVDAVYASPLKRAFETGKQVARHHRLDPSSSRTCAKSRSSGTCRTNFRRWSSSGQRLLPASASE